MIFVENAPRFNLKLFLLFGTPRATFPTSFNNNLNNLNIKIKLRDTYKNFIDIQKKIWYNIKNCDKNK